MAPRENKNNAYTKFGGTNKEFYDIFRSGLFHFVCYDATRVSIDLSDD